MHAWGENAANMSLFGYLAAASLGGISSLSAAALGNLWLTRHERVQPFECYMADRSIVFDARLEVRHAQAAVAKAKLQFTSDLNSVRDAFSGAEFALKKLDDKLTWTV
jgi:hypothetical protein